jgi:hypothetical protein
MSGNARALAALYGALIQAGGTNLNDAICGAVLK